MTMRPLLFRVGIRKLLSILKGLYLSHLSVCFKSNHHISTSLKCSLSSCVHENNFIFGPIERDQSHDLTNQSFQFSCVASLHL